ncbi:MAG: lipase family protein [Chitinophagaceae bacterium]
MNFTRLTVIACLACVFQISNGQKLKPGFDAQEYFELLKVSSMQGDSLYNPNLPYPEKFKRVYRSSVMGLDNRWELWISPDSVAVVSIRGTTMNQLSWMENFYAAMVPAKGMITMADNFNFDYELSPDKDAAVHLGWLIGTAFLARDIVPKIDSLKARGIRDIIIMGHSQGGAIATLLTSYLQQLKTLNKLDSDIQFKTYASAAPKAGNLYYAYSFEAISKGDWAFNVVNSADWVPEGPLSVQTTADFNNANPFQLSDELLKKQSFFKRMILSCIYRKVENPPKKANKRYQKYFGKMVGKNLEKKLPGYVQPAFYNSSNYTRVGHQIVLYATADYFKLFPNDPKMIWNHHRYEAYYYLLNGTIVLLNGNTEKSPM